MRIVIEIDAITQDIAAVRAEPDRSDLAAASSPDLDAGAAPAVPGSGTQRAPITAEASGDVDAGSAAELSGDDRATAEQVNEDAEEER